MGRYPSLTGTPLRSRRSERARRGMPGSCKSCRQPHPRGRARRSYPELRARAYATRVLGRWHDRLDKPLALLKKRAADESPRVRLEALVAASDVRGGAW